jgi:hypothetical protein
MKKVLILLSVVWGALAAFASGPAGVELISLSPRISPATAEDPFTGLEWGLSISSLTDLNNPNGELSLADDSIPYTHQGNFFVQDPQTSETFGLPFVLDVPLFADVNGNGIWDFFDPEVEIANVQTEGRHPDTSGGGADFTATWNRAAGSTTGTVRIDLPFFGLSFTHTFEILSYSGTFQFAPSTNTLSGTVELTNNAAAEDRLTGPLTLSILDSATLSYSASAWTNADGVEFDYSPVDHLDLSGLNYISLLAFQDGSPATSDPDYLSWLLVVKSADENTNGIPDLVESSPSNGPATLQIVKSQN